MKTISYPYRQNQAAYALLVTMTFLAMMLVVFITMMFFTTSNAKLTQRNNQYNASEAAAEAATETVVSQMTHDYEFGSLSNSGTYYGTSFLPTNNQGSWPIQYTYSNPSNSTSGQIYVSIGAWTASAEPLDSQFTGLYGEEQDVTIAATATPATGTAVPSTVTETLQFASIPLFQFAIFYNVNLEIAAAQTLDIVGPVYSNGGIWSGSDTITFSSTVSAVGLATNEVGDPFCAGYSGSGRSTYTITNQPTSGNDTLTMPVGTNNNPASVEAVVNIPPSSYPSDTSAAYTTNGELYTANAADLFVTNYPSGTNQGWRSTFQVGAPMAVYYQDAANGPNYLAWATNDFYLVSNVTVGKFYATNWVPIYSPAYANGFLATNGFIFTNNITTLRFTNTSGTYVGTNIVWYMGYSFLTNVLFYDWREGWHLGSGPAKVIYATQLDLKAMNVWMTNDAANNNDIYGGSNYNAQCQSSFHKSRPIDSMYIFNAVPLSSTVLPAVRVMNGGMMPANMGSRGFGLATAMQIYVWGDYNVSNSLGSSISENNTVYTEPAALMGDAVTILSDSWLDTNSLALHTGGPSASQTTINAGCMEGIVESNTNNAASEGTSDGYSGGVENFLRTLENWSSVKLWYNGSIVVMFPSQYATNCWQQTGYYYTAPSRSWAFDTNFMIQADLPPLMPQAKGVIRGTWAAQ